MNGILSLLGEILAPVGTALTSTEPAVLTVVNVVSVLTVAALIASAISISLNSRVDNESISQLSIQGLLLPGFTLSLITFVQIYYGTETPEPGDFLPLVVFFVFLVIQQNTFLYVIRYVSGNQLGGAPSFLTKRFSAIAESFHVTRIEERISTIRTNISVLLIDASLIVVIAIAIALISPIIFAGHSGLFVVNTFASLTLLVIGLMIMIRAKDVISQVMGLSVAFNGLYVIGYTFLSPEAAATISPELQILLFLCLFSGTFLSFAIAYALVPQLFASSKSIEVKRQDILNELNE